MHLIALLTVLVLADTGAPRATPAPTPVPVPTSLVADTTTPMDSVPLSLREAELLAYESAQDTVPTTRRRRVVVVEYSDAYTTRLNIHRWISYPIVPLFAAQWYFGSKLMDNQAGASSTVRNGHRVIATATAAVFTINTATGVLNLWEGRNDPSGRVKKWLHTALFVVADAGFIYSAKLAKDAQLYGQVYRERHRTVALSSMGLSVASWAMMLFLKD